MKYKPETYYLIKATYLDSNIQEHVLYFGRNLKFNESPQFSDSIAKISVPRLEERIPLTLYYKGLEMYLMDKTVYSLETHIDLED